jgi:hypothetical protein
MCVGVESHLIYENSGKEIKNEKMERGRGFCSLGLGARMTLAMELCRPSGRRRAELQCAASCKNVRLRRTLPHGQGSSQVKRGVRVLQVAELNNALGSGWCIVSFNGVG